MNRDIEIASILGDGLGRGITEYYKERVHMASMVVMEPDASRALRKAFLHRLIALAVGELRGEFGDVVEAMAFVEKAVVDGFAAEGIEAQASVKTTAPEVPSRQPAPREATGPEALLMAWARLVKGRSYKVSKCVDGHGKWAITLEGPFFAPETASYTSIDELDSGLTSAANFALDDTLDELKRHCTPTTIDILGGPGACYARVNLRGHHYCTTVRVDVWQARAEALEYLHTLMSANAEARIFPVDPLDVWCKQAEKNGYDLFEFSPGHWGYRLLERGRPCAITSADFPSREEARKHAAEKANDLMEEDS